MSGSSDVISLPLKAVISLAVEHWRLDTWVKQLDASADAGAARYALRRMNDVLAACQIEGRDLTGQVFDPGLAARVVDTVEDATLKPGDVIIDETVAPLVLWQGRVVHDAEVVTRHGPLP